jgi:glycosyltransferase involved in cell wall biosynthesis
LVTTSFPRAEDDPSGHFVLAAARREAMRGMDVHVVAPGGTPWSPPSTRWGVVVHRAGGGSLFGWPGVVARVREAPWRAPLAGAFLAGAAARIRAICRVGRVSRAIGHFLVPSAYPLLLNVDAQLEVFAHGGDVRLLVGAPRAFADSVVRALVDRDARFTFAARAVEQQLVNALSERVGRDLLERSHVEPPPIDVPDVRAHAKDLRASVGVGASDRLVVVAGRLIPSKRVELAIQACARANVSLVVVGDGPARASLEALAASQGSSRVVFTGSLVRREALAWIAAADVLVHPSAVEAAPSVVREARALGVRVVACDAGDVASWAEDDAGIHVCAGTSEDLARALAI